MALSENDFASIKTLVERIISERGEPFMTGTVIKRDEARRLVWLAETGDQPIPCLAFNFQVLYYDENKLGTIGRKETNTNIITPKLGDTVLVAFERGTRRLPRCLGVIQSLEFVRAEES